MSRSHEGTADRTIRWHRMTRDARDSVLFQSRARSARRSVIVASVRLGGATAKAHQPQRGDMFIARPYRNLRKPRRGGMVLPRTGQCRPYGACGKDRGRGGHYKHVAPTELAQPSSCTGRLDSVSVDCWTSLARRQFIRVFPCLCGLAAYPVRHEANAIMSKKANPFPLLENMTVTLMRHT